MPRERSINLICATWLGWTGRSWMDRCLLHRYTACVPYGHALQLQHCSTVTIFDTTRPRKSA